MLRVIKHGAITEDTWLPIEPEAAEAPAGGICTLEQWQALADKHNSAVQIEPGDGIDALLNHLNQLALVTVNFPVFTDGRAFSYARELRQRGYTGELRATGHFLPDQLTYLHRVGCDSFAPAEDADWNEYLGREHDFSVHYQAAIDEPQPLFQRR